MTEPDRVGGRYELGELLGRGGMAEVRKGQDVRLGRTVAVKRLRTDLASDPTFQARFRREAQSAASLNHPAIVSVYDTGEEREVQSDGSTVAQPYIVMEYVAGRTLRDILREGRKILPERALEITSGVLAALDYSHRMGIIHRDIKPANVMLTPTGDVKVMDFGIARAAADVQTTMTQTAAVVGTAQYLSPEQARGEKVDSRSDVYSAGCLLYELLTGRPPFVGESPVSVAYQHVREQAAAPSAHDADLPPAIDAIVMKSLAKRADDRYSSAAEMKADIDRYLAGQAVLAPPPPPSAVTGVIAATSEPVAVVERRNRPWLWVALLLLLLALIIGAIFALQHLLKGAPPQTSVPDLRQQTEAAARQKLASVQLAVGTVTHGNSDVAAGEVMSQDPEAGKLVNPGAAVNFVISDGPAKVTIPDVTGLTQEAATTQLQQLGLQVSPRAQSKADPNATPGTVVKTDPVAGTKVDKNAKVTIFYVPAPIAVPDVRGLSEADARKQLSGVGFTNVTSTPDPTSTDNPGSVTRTIPTAGTSISPNQQITLYIAQAPPAPAPTAAPAPSSAASGPPVP